ncbi:MAG: cell division protein FtsL [Thiotrichaceae bacterium]
MKSWKVLLIAVLYVGVIVTAIKVVMNRHEARNLFSELQQLEKERDSLTAQWSRLKLEEGTRLNQVVVEKRARQEMNMRVPRQSDIKIINE